jgi:anti-sigma B factor antagonist
MRLDLETPLTVGIEERGPDVLVFLSGELDHWTAEKVVDALDDALWRSGPGSIVVDASELWFIDSGGLTAFVHGTAAARARGGDLVIVGARPMLIRLVETLRIGHLLTLRESAVAA